MPATGKSTVGHELATRLSYELLDVDSWMESHEGLPVKQIIDTYGREHILELENRVLSERDLHEVVVSPPGSIIYTPALKQLREQTYCVLLDTPLHVLESRLAHDVHNERGVIGLNEFGLGSLYEARMPVYRQWAQLTIECGGRTPQQIATQIVSEITAKGVLNS